jgi:hypothetical protein
VLANDLPDQRVDDCLGILLRCRIGGKTRRGSGGDLHAHLALNGGCARNSPKSCLKKSYLSDSVYRT